MSTLRVPCGCGTSFDVPAALAGKTIRCKTCSAMLTVPAAAPLPVVKPAAVVKAKVAPAKTEPVEPAEKGPTTPAKTVGNPFHLPMCLLLGGYFPFLFACTVGAMVAGGLLVRWGYVGTSQALDTVTGTGSGGNPFGVFGMVVGGVLALAGLHACVGLLGLLPRKEEPDPFEIDLPDQWQEGLQVLVEEVAASRDLPVPDAIRLHATTVAHIYQDRDGKQVLAVGGLAVAALPKRALAGVIAHELAHVAGGDTALSRAADKMHRVMGRLEYAFLSRRIHQFNPIAWLIRGYQLVYLACYFASSRRREYQADAYEVEHVGREEAAATLIRITVVETMEYTKLANVAEGHIEMNLPLDRIFAEQVRRLKGASASEWTDAYRLASRAGTRWSDTHPGLEDRLAAIGTKPKKAIMRAMDLSGEPSTDLFANWPLAEKFLTKKVVDIVRENYLERKAIAEVISAVLRDAGLGFRGERPA